MAATHDTIKGLLAEFRGYSHGMPPSYHVTMSWADFRKMLDRFEAAHRRERGDCAKLREALKHIKDRLPHMLQYMRVHWEDASAGGYFDELMLVIDAALAAPLRNCDVGTVGQQDERFTAFCNRHFKAVGLCDKDCPCRDFNMIGGACSIVWAQMPYEEGGAK